jgi:hypothetical protein
MAGNSRVLDTAPVASWRSHVRVEAVTWCAATAPVEGGASASSSATEQNSVEVSRANRTVRVIGVIVMRDLRVFGASDAFGEASREPAHLEETLDSRAGQACYDRRPQK